MEQQPQVIPPPGEALPVRLGGMALQVPANVDIQGGRVVRLREFSAFTGQIFGNLTVSGAVTALTVALTTGLYLPDGTAALPGLSFNSEKSTGIYRPAAGQMGFSTLGVSRLILDDRGHLTLGIGSSPPLHDSTLPMFYMPTAQSVIAGPTNSLVTNAYYQGGVWKRVAVGYATAWNVGTGAFAVYGSATAAADAAIAFLLRLNIDLNGDMGIGRAALTTNPPKLDVDGPIRTSGAGATVGGELRWSGDGTGYGLTLRSQNQSTGALNTTVATIFDNGHVCIGTTSDLGYKLSAQSDGATTPSAAFVGQGDTNRRVYVGYNSTSEYGYVRAVKEGTGHQPLILNELGARVCVGLQGSSRNNCDFQIVNSIGFPATQVASTDVNALDDYEEGSWTPTLGGTATYTTQGGWYTKIGRVVEYGFRITVTTIGTGSTYLVTGLPFSCPGAGSGCGNYAASLATNIVSMWIYVSGTTVNCLSFTAAQANVAANAIFGNSADLIAGGTYEV